MYCRKTEQQLNIKTRGKKNDSFYYKLVPIQNEPSNKLHKTTNTEYSSKKPSLRLKKQKHSKNHG